ncbi:MAG: leucine-rich repeat protein, partial [Lachnospiraceae bacterium]
MDIKVSRTPFIFALSMIVMLFLVMPLTANAAQDVYALYKQDGAVYKCDNQGANPEATPMDKNLATHLFIEEGVRLIPEGVFANCGNLTTVKISSTVTQIGSYAFKQCTELRTVDFSNATNLVEIHIQSFTKTKIESVDLSASANLTMILDGAFWRCEELRTVDLTNTKVTELTPLVFQAWQYGRTKLTSIALPATITSIQDRAFCYCDKLMDITFDSVDPPSIPGKDVFLNTPTGMRIHLPAGADESKWTPISSQATDSVVYTNNLFGLYKDDGKIYYCDSRGKMVGAEIDQTNKKEVTRLYIENNVKTINESAFDGFQSLENVFFPSTNLPVIGKDAFKNSKDGMNIVLPEGADLTEWTNALINAGATNPNFNIGSRYGLYKADGKVYNCDSTGTPTSGEIDKFDVSYLFIADDVTQVINTMGFYKYGVLRTIDMTHATQLTAIGNEAFANCSTLNTVIVGKGITSIGSRAFFECENLQYVDLSQAGSLSKIDFQAFYTCSRLVDISFNLVNPPVIEMGAFDGTKEFLRIHLPDNTKKSDWEGKLNGARNPVLCVGSLNSLYKSDGNIYFSDSNGKDEGAKIDSAGQKNITYMSIASDVKKIADSAFANCANLDGIKFNSATLIPMEKKAFKGIKTSINIYLPQGADKNQWEAALINAGAVTPEIYIGKLHGLYKSDKKYYNCDSTGKQVGGEIDVANVYYLFIADNVVSIDELEFSMYKNLESVDCSSATKLKTIGESAFQDCSGITKIVLSPSIETIGIAAFAKCGAIENVDLSQLTALKKISKLTFADCVNLRNIKFPDNITVIGEQAFYGCNKLETLQLPSSLNTIESAAFNKCYALKSVDFSKATQLKTIGGYAFQQCFNLKDLIISPSVTDMGPGVFWECRELESIVLPPNITEIKERTFELCVKLVEISIPEKVTKIGQLAFEGCSSLVNVRLPKSLESIGYGTFFGCTGLTSIYIPGNTKNIGDMAFWQCSNLANVSSYATVPPTMYVDTFRGTTDGIKIYLLANADENSWRSALINSGAKNPTFYKIVLPTGEIKIKENSFKTTISNITFDLFYKESVDVELIINGTQSMNQSVEYQKVSKPEDYKEDGIWTAYTGIININKAEKCIIYARNIDKFGNKTIINSNGFVVYQDSTIQPSTLEFDKESTKQADIDLAMTLNGNVLKKIKDGTEILVKDTDYFIKGSTVTLKKKYLAKLANGNQTLDFDFAAMGVSNGPIMTIPFHFTVKDTTH